MSKYSRLGIAVVAVVWAIVLLVPSLNVLFRAQLQERRLLHTDVWFERKKQEISWDEVAQKFPGDKDVLFQAALEYPVVERDEIIGWEKPEPPFPPPEMDENGEVVPLPEKLPITVPIFHRSVLFPGTPARELGAERARRLSLLVEKYPRDTVILATYLRNALPTYFGRVAGEMEDLKLEENQKAGKPSPEVNPKKSPYTLADLKRAIELCERGSRLEPENGFYDWMKCAFLMLAWQDAHALQTLDSAAAKRLFEDHHTGELQSALVALGRAQGRELLAEEKHTFLMWAEFSEFSRYSRIARLLAWKSLKARRRGNHQLALRIAGSSMRIAAHLRDSQRIETGYSLAASLEGLVRGGPIYDEQKEPLQSRKNFTSKSLALFQAYANQHGRKDLAEEAARNHRVRKIYIETRTQRGHFGVFGIPYGILLGLKGLWDIGLLSLLLLPAALIVGGVMRGVQGDTSKQDEVPPQSEVWNGALACGGLRAFAPFLLLGAFILFRPWEWRQSALRADEYGALERTYFLLSIYSDFSPFFYFLALTPLLYGGLFAAWRASEWQKRMNGEVSKQSFLRKGLGFMGMGCLTFAWFLLAKSKTDGLGWLILLGLVILFAGLLLLEKYFSWRKRPLKKATVCYGCRLLQQSLLVWVVLGSVFYLLVSVASFPLRHAATAGIERALTLGEVQMSGVLDEVLTESPNPL